MFLLSKNDCWADRSIQALFSGYQERLVTFNSIKSQVVQRPRRLTTRICVIGTQKVFFSSITNILRRFRLR